MNYATTHAPTHTKAMLMARRSFDFSGILHNCS